MTDYITEPMDAETRAAIAALLALSAHNIPPDIQELLVYGDPKRDIAPGALANAISAVFTSYKSELDRK